MNSYEFEEFCKAMPNTCIDLTGQRMVAFIRKEEKRQIKGAYKAWKHGLHGILPDGFWIGAVGMLAGGATALFAVLLAIGG